METQGLSGHGAMSGGSADRARLVGTTLITFPALSHALAGCSSSFSSSPTPDSTAVAVPPPPNGPPGAAGQPAYAPPSQPVDPSATMLPYPRRSLFQNSPDPQVAAMPHPPGSYTPAGQPTLRPQDSSPLMARPARLPRALSLRPLSRWQQRRRRMPIRPSIAAPIPANRCSMFSQTNPKRSNRRRRSCYRHSQR
jgi:hypothetical protein